MCMVFSPQSHLLLFSFPNKCIKKKTFEQILCISQYRFRSIVPLPNLPTLLLMFLNQPPHSSLLVFKIFMNLKRAQFGHNFIGRLSGASVTNYVLLLYLNFCYDF